MLHHQLITTIITLVPVSLTGDPVISKLFVALLKADQNQKSDCTIHRKLCSWFVQLYPASRGFLPGKSFNMFEVIRISSISHSRFVHFLERSYSTSADKVKC